MEAVTVGMQLYKFQLDPSSGLEWERAPARGYAWAKPESIENERSTYVPFRGISVSKYRDIIKKDFSDKQMEKLLFSNIGSWGHKSLISHPELNITALPLDWSIMFDEYKKSIEKKIQRGLELIDSDELTEEQEEKVEKWIQKKSAQINT